ncbi:hypothetical protein [uncultured Campylobacter sp.]|uniref:hypothetical protein n=1 Tax=uncultured Campylobacter sp. TaxID=218934 RepID=UPI00262A9C21|nr:hypothetical protein [uncultured Campylobacter sp.]
MKTRYYLCLAFIIIICASGIIFYSAEKIETDPYEWICNLDGNLTDIQLKDRALKCMLKDWHFFYNFNKREYDRRIKAVKKEYDDTANEIGGGVEIRYSECHSDKRPDDKCEFYKIDKRLNLDYLMDLGSKICRNGKAIQDAETHIDKEIFNTEVVYPWEDKESLVLEDGSLKYGIFFNYIDEDDYRDRESGEIILTEKIFNNSLEIDKSFGFDHTDIVFVIPINSIFLSLYAYIEPSNPNYDIFCHRYEQYKNRIKIDEASYKIDDFKTPIEYLPLHVNYSFLFIVIDKNMKFSKSLEYDLLYEYYYDEKEKTIKQISNNER